MCFLIPYQIHILGINIPGRKALIELIILSMLNKTLVFFQEAIKCPVTPNPKGWWAQYFYFSPGSTNTKVTTHQMAVGFPVLR